MAEPQLSVESAKPRDLAHRLARREPAAAFYARLADDCGADLDLESVIRDARRIHTGPDL